MEFINDIFSALHLPGASFTETVGAGFAMYLGVVVCRVALGFGQQLLSRAGAAARQGGQVAGGRRR